MNENISKQLINRIVNKLSGIKPFLNVVEFDDFNDNPEIFTVNYDKINKITYHRGVISVSVKELEQDLDNYNLVIHLLDKIMLELTINVTTKNYYFINDTIEEDMIEVMNKLEKVKWFMTYETHLELLSMLDPNGQMDNWTNFEINGRKIHTMESSFPKSLIFGSEYPVIINPKLLISETFEELNVSVIRVPFYYTKDFYAMRLITDETQKKLFLRQKKIKKLRN